jgi:hypothetical protein
MQLALEPKRYPAGCGGHIYLRSAEPFVENTRAVLIHRVRHATIHTVLADRWGPHLSVTNWCGNGFSSRKHLSFLAAPPTGKLVCARCEENAVQMGQPSSSEIAGRHVCLGGVRAYSACAIHPQQWPEVQG